MSEKPERSVTSATVQQSSELNLAAMMAEIEEAAPAGGTWCSVEKAATMASMILALRPKVVVELGVWMGGSAIPMAIALRYLSTGQLIAVDAWSAEASVEGQAGEDAKWWGEKMGRDGHDQAFKMFKARLEKHRIGSDRCIVVRKRTDQASVPPQIDVLHHDANHGPQVIADIRRWIPAVRVGGICVIDDIDWPGGHVRRARDLAIESGFVELYQARTATTRPWSVLQRVSAAAVTVP